ncbi:DUF599 domain-containing protein [Gilvimarinus sp. F26214L]|uniref:DUF599 domain-containing protein n=1 Tax=Gilvimarinus sp. DZF01 TaxID=3461371 RepID=UPI0040466285
MDFADIRSFFQLNTANLIALAWFLLCYRGYFLYTEVKSRTHPTLSYAMHRHRQQWIRSALSRDNRIADTNIIANLERNVSFFASSTLLVLAGLMTVLGSSDTVTVLLNDVPFSDPAHRGEWELKILLLVFLFVYAFFKFTWALRQYGFVAVMLGGAKLEDYDRSAGSRSMESIAKMASKAGGNFNNGLRTYYFSLAILGWFINAWVFMALSTLMVPILYRREFSSETLRALLSILPEEPSGASLSEAETAFQSARPR